MEHMVEAGLELGLSKELSENLVKATAVGAGNGFGQLSALDRAQANVTSPGGTTEAGNKLWKKVSIR